jgi:hypothetical protein
MQNAFDKGMVDPALTTDAVRIQICQVVAGAEEGLSFLPIDHFLQGDVLHVAEMKILPVIAYAGGDGSIRIDWQTPEGGVARAPLLGIRTGEVEETGISQRVAIAEIIAVLLADAYGMEIVVSSKPLVEEFAELMPVLRHLDEFKADARTLGAQALFHFQQALHIALHQLEVRTYPQLAIGLLVRRMEGDDHLVDPGLDKLSAMASSRSEPLVEKDT